MIYEQVPLLSVREIAATKAYTIGRFYLPSSVYLKPFARTIRKWIIVWISAHTRSCAICRGAYKEIDLYFILSQQHAMLTNIIDVAEKKFGFEFNSRLFLEQLVFLDDVEDTDIQFLKSAVTRAGFLGFFEANIRANAERL